jgi:hypothetical protein
VYLDILGFKEKVEEADKNAESRQILLNILDSVRTSFGSYDKVGMQFTHFSDCLILSANRTPDGLKAILNSIVLCSLNLLVKDFFIRGGLAVGGIHHDQYFIYGLAVNKAYEIELNKATYPMTFISDEVITDMKADWSRFCESVIENADGNYFVHYLKQFSDYTMIPQEEGGCNLKEPSLRIIDFICNRLNEHSNNPNVLKKDVWFQNYWNNTVAVNGVLGRIEAGVTDRDPGHGSFRAIVRNPIN